VNAGVLLLIAILALLGGALWLGLRRFGALRLWPVGILILTAPLEIYRTNLGTFNLSLFRMALVWAGALTVLDFIRRSTRGWRIPAPLLPYGLILLIQMASLVFVSTNRTLGYRYFSQYLAGLAAAVVIAYWARARDLKTIIVLFLSGATLPAIGAAWRVMSVSAGGSGSLPGVSLLPVDPSVAAERGRAFYLPGGAQRIQSTFNDPNHFGFFAATVLCIGLAALLTVVIERRERSGPRLIVPTAAAVATLSLALIGSYSRSAWLLAGASTILLASLIGIPLWRRLIDLRLVAAVGVVLSLGVLVLAPVVANRVNPSNPGTAVSNTEHSRTLRIAAQLAVDHPLTGVGFGSYGRYAGEPLLVSSAHSTFFTTAAELGFPGLFLLIASMGLAAGFGAREVRRAPDPFRRVLLAGLVGSYGGLAIANIFYEVWFDDFQWVIYGAVLSLTCPPQLVLRRAMSRRVPLPAFTWQHGTASPSLR